MKTYLLTLIILLFIAPFLKAQTKQGSMVLSGSIGYNASNGKINQTDYPDNAIQQTQSRSTTNSIYLSPSLGYFIADNLEIGVAAGYSHSNMLSKQMVRYFNDNFENSSEQQSKQFSFNPYVRKYYFLTEKFAFLAIADASFNKYTTSWESNRFQFADDGTMEKNIYQSESSNQNITGAISPGVSFFVSKNVSLHGRLGAIEYTRHKYGSEWPDGESNFSNNMFRFSLSPHHFYLGLSIFIAR